MNRILFLHDTDLSLLRGAELTIKQLMAFGTTKGFAVSADAVTDFDQTRAQIAQNNLVIVCSTSRCTFEKELLGYLIDQAVRYIKIEFDYNFCMRRTVQCTVDPAVSNCCDVTKFHLYRDLFAKSEFCVFQSPRHYEIHAELFGKAIHDHLVMPPTVEVDALQIAKDKDQITIPFFGDLSVIKGGQAYLDYAAEHPEKQFVVYGQNRMASEISSNVVFKDMVPNERVLEILGKTRYFFCKPFWPEPSGRLAAEAFLSGCEIIANDRVGTFSFDFYPNDPERAKSEIKATIPAFWDKVTATFEAPSARHPKLGRVLVKKSSGGIGDFFFCIPALHALNAVSESVTFAIMPRLVSFFGHHLQGLEVIDQDSAQTQNQYDVVVELGNYPAYLNGFKLPDAIAYTTHHKLKQHASAHYLDAVARLHPDCDVRMRFPYFEHQINTSQPYYTLHAGAGAIRKAWSVAGFANLILQIHAQFPQLKCKIIQGPGDPNPLDLFDTKPEFIDTVTGGMDQVGEAMAGAWFHIGNDSGITHVAGAFNVPTVGIYGPTGPGAWGSMAEHSEIVWGKPGNCDIACNSNVLEQCGNRVCLSAIDTPQVMAKWYALLQNAYPQNPSVWVLNPGLKVDQQEKSCMLSIDGNEFDIDFADASVKSNVLKILSGNFSVSNEENMPEFVDFLFAQKMLFAIPSIPSRQDTKKPRKNVV
ncbi:glycosyltransferase family 9 protein [Flavobacterium caeni]|uniref:Glycosyltransferase family 9 (Heptosyltransferase) n=1 Tax=Flavobacterium caeni TaxID=490189 RepID=A0A1G5DYC7_9FLAO|nr:glycosyltransferase family 9 protein [Flavobacterium caeni]SCY19627.1 Glycosyltransferase family 9 (heptosyltransferase) [Flavobacterium caeni]